MCEHCDSIWLVISIMNFCAFNQNNLGLELMQKVNIGKLVENKQNVGNQQHRGLVNVYSYMYPTVYCYMYPTA